MRDLVYLNNATDSFPKAPACVHAYMTALTQPSRDIRHVVMDKPEIDTARMSISNFVGATPDQIYFCSDATLGVNLVLQGFLERGSRCLIDNRSHNAVTRTLYGMRSVDWQVVSLYMPTEEIDLAAFERIIEPSTSLVCLTHVSNVTGSIYDITPIAKAIRTAMPEAAIFVDASQSAGCADLRVLAEADFAVFSSHKFLYAPPGAAVVIAKRPLRQRIFGGTGTRSANLETEEKGKNLVEVGTPNAPAIAALVAGLLLADQERSKRQAYADSLTDRLWKGLSCIRGISLLGRPPGQSRTGVVSFTGAGTNPEQEWMPYLNARGIVARGGLHCCPLFHEQAGLQVAGSVRISPGIFSTADDIDFLVMAVEQFMGAAG